VTTAKLDQRGEHQPEKEARECDRQALGEKGQTSRLLRPLRARDSGQLAHEAHELGSLEIVGGPGEDHTSAERPMVQVSRNLRHFIVIENDARIMLDLLGEAIGGAERAVPQGRQSQREADADRERDVAPGATPEGDRANRRADQKPGGKAGPEIAPQDDHVLVLASSRQPMSVR